MRDVPADEVTLAQDTGLVIFIHCALLVQLAEVVHVPQASTRGVDLGV